MKLIFATAALIALSAPAFAGGVNANANSSSNSASGAIAGVIYNEGDGHRWTGAVGVGINSSNNSPCGRTTFGIPSSGENCTARMEAQAIYNSMVDAFGQKAASRAATHHLCANDRTMRATLIAAGVCKLK